MPVVSTFIGTVNHCLNCTLNFCIFLIKIKSLNQIRGFISCCISDDNNMIHEESENYLSYNQFISIIMLFCFVSQVITL